MKKTTNESRTAEIGHVIFGPNDSRRATLWGNDDWTAEVNGVDRPELAIAFRLMYQGEFQGPEYGYYGQVLLARAAKDWEGRAEMVQEFLAPKDDGLVVY